MIFWNLTLFSLLSRCNTYPSDIRLPLGDSVKNPPFCTHQGGLQRNLNNSFAFSSIFLTRSTSASQRFTIFSSKKLASVLSKKSTLFSLRIKNNQKYLSCRQNIPNAVLQKVFKHSNALFRKIKQRMSRELEA